MSHEGEDPIPIPNEKTFKMLVEDPSTAAEDIMNALLEFIQINNPNIVRILIKDERVNPDAALETAIACSSEEMVGVLLESGRVPKNNNNNNYLRKAMLKNKVDILRLLLEKTDADIQKCNSALHAAASGGHLECLQVLMQVPGIDLNICELQQSALLCAIEHRHIDIVEALIEDDRVDVTSKCCRFCSPLCAAAEKDSLEMVKTMLQNPRVKAHEYDDDRATPVHYAAIANRADIVLLLLDHDFDGDADTDFFSEFDEQMVTPLLLAAQHGSARVVEVLLERGFGASTDWLDRTALHVAAEKGFAHVVKVILEDGGIGVNDKCELGQTPLHYAAENNHSRVVKLLLQDEYIEPNAVITSLDGFDTTCDGYTPIQCAAYCNSLDALQVLLGDDRINILDLNGILDDDEAILDTAIHAAVRNDSVDALKMMLPNNNNDAYVNCPDSLNRTPLYIAASNGSIQCAKYLLQCDTIDVNLRSLGHCEYMYSALHIACRNGFLEIIEALLQADTIDVNATLEEPGGHFGDGGENEMETPLHLACANGQTQVVQMLLKNQFVDVNAVDSFGFSPLGVACANGYTKIVQLLLAEDDVELQNDDEDHHPLCVAAKNGQTEVVRVLLKDGRITISDIAENPLCLAVGNGHLRTAKLLLESGSDIYGVNADGNTALHMAAAHGNIEIAKWLLSSGADGTILNNDGKIYLDVIASKSAYFMLASESITTLILCLRKIFPLEIQQKIVHLAFSPPPCNN